ncbi:M14 family zinc carboxypeptidase [Bacillaceae bacterium S4-13-58]
MNILVQPGQTLWSISQTFGIPLNLIADSNPNVIPTQLQVGQNLRIPGYRVLAHRIQPGDTFWSISNRYQTPMDVIRLMNPWTIPTQLMIGSTLYVPVRLTERIVQTRKAYDYSSLQQDLQRLRQAYPFIRQESIGQSVLGSSIDEIQIGRGAQMVHANSSFHANEWITTPIMIQFLNDYLLTLTNQTPIRGLSMNPFYTRRTLSLVPMVNPDGVNLVLNGPPNIEPYRSQVIEMNQGNLTFNNWKANIRGVDLNNQFPAGWEIEKERKEQSPGPRDYPGEAPLTEPESIAMAELTNRRNFSRVNAFHTQGEVIYWGFRNQEPPEAAAIVKEYARVSGYKPVQTVDSYAGYKDWFIQEWNRPGYTVELGTGVNPLPLSQFDEIYEESLGIFLANLYM